MTDTISPEDHFRAYMAAFNASDWAALSDFYAPDIRLTIGNGTELIGRQAIIDFYTGVKSQTRRTIKVLNCFSDGPLLAAELESEFLALENIPDFTSRPLNKGDRYYINSVALYEARAGQYIRIRAAVMKREYRQAG
ncbi:nuclear transport factor 2 family protein [Altericroceibacterium endophyticum]|uniref:DUF4440 domain-containing protein n=1 Tax=Altericroceibacterium endophyticum TaxID=1808508 RepID=A0A6I4T8K2_9SPHN|nr:nuclear transport factor 2 family protein [Altericroceibacterium endophyticum]MXO66592.1 DUF4440 domain-containing protein [Altericroceibacterium endophyticum]